MEQLGILRVTRNEKTKIDMATAIYNHDFHTALKHQDRYNHLLEKERKKFESSKVHKRYIMCRAADVRKWQDDPNSRDVGNYNNNAVAERC